MLVSKRNYHRGFRPGSGWLSPRSLTAGGWGRSVHFRCCDWEVCHPQKAPVKSKSGNATQLVIFISILLFWQSVYSCNIIFFLLLFAEGVGRQRFRQTAVWESHITCPVDWRHVFDWLHSSQQIQTNSYFLKIWRQQTKRSFTFAIKHDNYI